MNITILKDVDSEMLEININGKPVFFGNYWDFSAPKDIEKLLLEVEKSCSDVNLTVSKVNIEC